MGRDKATLIVGGEPLGRRALRALRGAGISEVVLVGGTPTHAEALHADVIGDEQPGDGPLPAVLTALRHASASGFSHVVVLACDLPNVRAEDVSRLLAESGPPGGVGLVVASVDDVAAFPNGVWATSMIPQIEASVAAGERGFRSIPTHLVTCVELGTAFMDADRPGDLPPARYPGGP